MCPELPRELGRERGLGSHPSPSSRCCPLVCTSLAERPRLQPVSPLHAEARGAEGSMGHTTRAHAQKRRNAPFSGSWGLTQSPQTPLAFLKDQLMTGVRTTPHPNRRALGTAPPPATDGGLCVAWEGGRGRPAASWAPRSPAGHRAGREPGPIATAS